MGHLWRTAERLRILTYPEAFSAASFFGLVPHTIRIALNPPPPRALSGRFLYQSLLRNRGKDHFGHADVVAPAIMGSKCMVRCVPGPQARTGGASSPVGQSL
jgi:hypothetical protein